MCILGAVGRHAPNVSEIARKLFKSRPWCKRIGYRATAHSVAFFY